MSLSTAAVMAALTLTGCSSHDEQTPIGTSSGTGRPKTSAAASPSASVRLAWRHTVKDRSGATREWYVARVKNSSTSKTSVTLVVRALDKTGTLVGSSEDILPDISAGATFDYFGEFGGAFSDSLTGIPAKLQLSLYTPGYDHARVIDKPTLGTSQVKLTEGDHDDLLTSAPHAYDLSAQVTNNTHDTVSVRITQQVVLYDAHGQVVGGRTGASDNVPNDLPSGVSYREEWTGIPATAEAVRAAYTVWTD
ncbi:hypothetical protein AB0E62_23210 [Streptomyces sp. NPDC038707]|uniref:hypothetical protein n=1 Tax=Streptomyces sp. NPDC038707 TaxID=3154329 RepID=UPI0033CCA567